MRLSDLRDKRLRTLDGKSLGRVHEVHCEKGRVVALMCGPGSLIERWTAQPEGRRIGWERVVRVEPRQIVVGPDKADSKAAKRPSAARTRPGTRQPSAQRPRR